MRIGNSLTAVVVGSDHQNTLGVIRSLGEAGICVKAVILSEGEGGFTARSKYIDEIYITSTFEMVDDLINIGAKSAEKLPLIPCGDDVAKPIAESYDVLSQWFLLHKTSDGINMHQLMKKTAMLEVARKLGLCVPEWVTLLEQDYKHMEQSCSHLKFPCILKPVDLKPGGFFEFHIVRNVDELLNLSDYICKNCKSVIVQQYIQKTGEFGVNACRLYHSGETIFCGIIEKKRFSQASLGSTTAGTICKDTRNLCEQAKKFVEGIDFRGIFDMEFITDGSQCYFVEMNFRNGGYGYACTKAGRNLPAIWTSDALEMSYDEFLKKPVKTTFFINESADLQNVRAGNCNTFTWLIDVLRAKAHMYINRKDMRPFWKKVIKG